jgi:hypothetical protein
MGPLHSIKRQMGAGITCSAFTIAVIRLSDSLEGGNIATKKYVTVSGEGGIRTHGGHKDHNGFRDRPIQPLWHLSNERDVTGLWVSRAAKIIAYPRRQ